MRLWDDNEWSYFVKPKDHVFVKEALEKEGFIFGENKAFINGKPYLVGDVDWNKVQQVTRKALVQKDYEDFRKTKRKRKK